MAQIDLEDGEEENEEEKSENANDNPKDKPKDKEEDKEKSRSPRRKQHLNPRPRPREVDPSHPSSPSLRNSPNRCLTPAPWHRTWRSKDALMQQVCFTLRGCMPSTVAKELMDTAKSRQRRWWAVQK